MTEHRPTPATELPDPGSLRVSKAETDRILGAIRAMPEAEFNRIVADLTKATEGAKSNREFVLAIAESIVSLRPIIDAIRGIA